MFNKKIPFASLLIACLASGLIGFGVSKFFNSGNELQSAENNSTENYNKLCDLKIPRLGGYDYIKPLLFVETSCESEKMSAIKNELTSYLEQQKATGVITAASVYLKNTQTPDWTGYNPDERHNPGSLLKVPQMMALLKMDELNPGFLQKRITYTKPFETAKVQEQYLSKTIQVGKLYTIKELIDYMIKYSDNNATLLLNTQLDPVIFKRIFTDISLPELDLNAQDYPISAKEYSYFMRSLYNASYLNIKNSEVASEILSGSDFEEGFRNALPANVKMIHKYGMARYNNGFELSESAIIYINEKAYVLTVMARGKDATKLSQVLRDVSAKVYNQVSTNINI